MTKKKTTATARPVAVPAPVEAYRAEIHARDAAEKRERDESHARLAGHLDAITKDLRGEGMPRPRPEAHSCLCLTCGSTFELSGCCSSDRPGEVEIPFDTMLQVKTLADDTGYSPTEVGSRLISIGLLVLGRGGWRERNDMIELWEASEDKPEADATRAGA